MQLFIDLIAPQDKKDLLDAIENFKQERSGWVRRGMRQQHTLDTLHDLVHRIYGSIANKSTLQGMNAGHIFNSFCILMRNGSSFFIKKTPDSLTMVYYLLTEEYPKGFNVPQKYNNVNGAVQTVVCNNNNSKSNSIGGGLEDAQPQGNRMETQPTEEGDLDTDNYKSNKDRKNVNHKDDAIVPGSDVKEGGPHTDHDNSESNGGGIRE